LKTSQKYRTKTSAPSGVAVADAGRVGAATGVAVAVGVVEAAVVALVVGGDSALPPVHAETAVATMSSAPAHAAPRKIPVTAPRVLPFLPGSL